MTIVRWWFAPAPATRLAAVRILVGLFATVYVVALVGELAALARLPAAQWEPIGPARLLGGPLPRELVVAIAIATAVLLAAFTVGYRYRVVAPLAALGLLFTTAIRSSWGMVFHTENLVVLHVIALACAPAADAWAITPEARGTDAGHGWPLKLLAAITAATYVLAGIAKLRLAGLAWADGDLLRDQVAIDNARKALLGDRIAPLATLLLAHPGGFVAFAVATLAVELGAPIVVVGDLLGRRGRALARWWAYGAWGFHVGVVLAMNIWFPYPLSAVPFVVVFRPERGIGWLLARARNVTPIESVRERDLPR